jgi:pimeloyl-ACP methyl ester carboxylesterase
MLSSAAFARKVYYPCRYQYEYNSFRGKHGGAFSAPCPKHLYQIQIPESELELLRRKLELTRLPRTTVKWREDNDVPDTLIGDTLKYWLESYDWRAAEALLNRLPQFVLPIEVDDGFGTLDIYFVHSTCSVINSIPLLFIYGWPGSFMEIQKGLPLLNEAGFHVVAPSLPGYGFSSYTDKAGFDIRRHAEVLNKLMLRLGYKSYVVQGGDWGAHIARTIGLMYPDNVKAVHQNMVSTSECYWYCLTCSVFR